MNNRQRTKRHHLKDRIVDIALKFWTLFIGIGALVGALMMWIDPSGKIWMMDPLLEMLQAKLPFLDIFFKNFLPSSFVLLTVNGITQYIAAILLFKKHRYAAHATLACGIILMLWIALEWYIFGFYPICNIYFAFGLLEALTALFAILGKHIGKNKKGEILKELETLSPETFRYFFPGVTIMEQQFCEDFYCAPGVFYECAEKELFDNDVKFAAAPPEYCHKYDIDEDVSEELILELERIQLKYGVSIEQLEAILSYKVRLSHLRITRHYEIILDDFDYQEVKMDTLTKAVYLLFLKHNEGIRFKELSDYKEELEEIYMSITGRTDLESIQRSIQSLTDPLNNSINEKVSKAKKAFKNVIDDRIAKFYYIDGKQGAVKRIALDRSLVIWE